MTIEAAWRPAPLPKLFSASRATRAASLREIFKAMFPDGLAFEPARTPDGSRQIWKISGEADFNHVSEPASPVSFR